MKTAHEIAASHYDADASQLRTGERITEGTPIGYLTGACDPDVDLIDGITVKHIEDAYAELMNEHGGLPR